MMRSQGVILMSNEKSFSPFYSSFLSLCSQKGVSPSVAARDSGISSGAPTAWKNGAVPKPAQREKLCNYFGVSDEVLLGYVQKEKAPIPEDERQKELDRLATEIREQTRMMKTVVDSTYNFYLSLRELAKMDDPIPRYIAFNPNQESDIKLKIAALVDKFMKNATAQEKSDFLSELTEIEEEFRRKMENPSETPYPTPEEIGAYGEMAKNLAMQQFLSEEKPDAPASSVKESGVG